MKISLEISEENYVDIENGSTYSAVEPVHVHHRKKCNKELQNNWKKHIGRENKSTSHNRW
jgi:hypothetical protein